MNWAYLFFSIQAISATPHFLDRYFGPDNEAVEIQQQQQQKPLAAFDPANDYVLNQEVHDTHVRIPSPDYVKDLNGPSMPLFAGIDGFAHLSVYDCFNYNSSEPAPEFDIAILGAPFDTGVSYRPGARFGPRGIRLGSRRIGRGGAYSSYQDGFNPYASWAKVVDCGDVAMTPFDNRVALNQLYRGHRAIHNLSSTNTDPTHKYTSSAPRIVTLGGDHTITFSALRSVYEVHGPVAVIHFDAHIDTWDPNMLGGNVSTYSQLNHGTFLHFAHEKGYLVPGRNMHVGIRAPYMRRHKDAQHDTDCGFERLYARDIDRIGIEAMARQIKERVGDSKVYISFDIDTLDPAYAAGTGTAEPGGFTSREVLELLELLKGLNIVGADVVEVAPDYDVSQNTVLIAAQIVDSFLRLMVSP